MKRYALADAIGCTPWERYLEAAATSIAAVLDREQAERSAPLGRALDLGCGRGHYTRELARRAWEALGVDHVVRAIDDAVRRPVDGADFVVGDVTDLPSVVSGCFELCLDVGCFQGLTPRQRRDTARGVTTLATARATVLLLAFQPTVLGWIAGGASRSDVERAFDGWEVLAVEAAETVGLGWALSRTEPQWYRLRRRPFADLTARRGRQVGPAVGSTPAVA